MLDTLIKKLVVVLVLCGGIASLLYFTDLGALFSGEAKKKVKEKVEEFKKETEEKIIFTDNEELQINVRQPFEPIGTGNTALDADKFYESDYKLNSDEIQLG